MTNSAIAVSLDTLESAIARVLGDTPADLAPLGAGAWSRAFSVTLQGQPLVARVGKPVDDFERDRRAATVSGPDLPVPQVLAIEPVPELGSELYLCVSVRARGTFIDDLDEAGMRALMPSLLATFDAMRAVDLSHTTGFGGWDAQGNAPFATWQEALLAVRIDDPAGRGHGWLRKLEDSRFGLDAWNTLLARQDDAVARIAPHADAIGRHVVHNDMLNFNMLCDGPRISALFDWGCVMTGDPLYDLAWFAFWQPWYPRWQAIDFVGTTRDHLAAIGVPMPGFDDRLRACLLFIALADIAYSASIERWHDVDAKLARSLRI
ncbi:MAG: phosphotransferase [Thermomicrobiales bacterium]